MQIRWEKPEISQHSEHSSILELTFSSGLVILQDLLRLDRDSRWLIDSGRLLGRGGQCQQDRVEVERQSGVGWHLIQVHRAWIMECLHLDEGWIARRWRSPETSDCSHLRLISILFLSIPDIKWQSSLSFLLSLTPTPKYVNNQTHFVWPCFIDFLSCCP